MSSIHVVHNGLNRSHLLRKFQLNGLTVRQDALTIFESELRYGQPPYKSLEDFISSLMSILLTIDCNDYIIDADLAQKAVDVLRDSRRNQTTDIQHDVVIRNVVDLDTQNNTNTKVLEVNFKYQYNQLLKSLKKLPVFESGQFTLMTIDDLNTYESNVELKCVVFAMICQDPSRIMEYYLEDLTGRIPVRFSSQIIWREWATFQNGIYLIEGTYEGQRDSFVITSIGLPPPINSILPKLIGQEEHESDPMVIFLADVHLDDRLTREALKFLLTGYDSLEEVPNIFIFIGDFVSKSIDKFNYKDHMKNLVKLISTFKKLLQNSRFVFVPGPKDPTRNVELFVKNPFTSDYFPTTTNRLKNYNLPSNPFHLQIKNRNICLFANNLMSKYIKNTINSNDQINAINVEKNDPHIMAQFFKALSRLIITDAHLTSGLNRNYLSSLSLFPQVPDLLLFADQQFQRNYQCQPYEQISSTRLATLPSFTKDSFQFLVYYVNSNELEESQIKI